MSKKNKYENEVVEEELLTAEKETTPDETIADIDPVEELKSKLIIPLQQLHFRIYFN